MKTAVYDPGWLRHRVTIEVAEGIPDQAGGESVTWSELATLWARIDPVWSDEQAVADHLAGVVSHRVIARWRDDLAGGMRIAYRGRLFRILALVDPDETRRYLEIKAEEIVT